MPLSDVNKYARDYKNTLSKDPNNTLLNNSIAMCYLKLKLYDKAQIALKKRLKKILIIPKHIFMQPFLS